MRNREGIRHTVCMKEPSSVRSRVSVRVRTNTLRIYERVSDDGKGLAGSGRSCRTRPGVIRSHTSASGVESECVRGGFEWARLVGQHRPDPRTDQKHTSVTDSINRVTGTTEGRALDAPCYNIGHIGSVCGREGGGVECTHTH